MVIFDKLFYMAGIVVNPINWLSSFQAKDELSNFYPRFVLNSITG